MVDDIGNNIDIDSLDFTQISSGFLLGLSVGYFLKKGFKIMLFILGLLTVALFWFNSQELITINNNKLIDMFDVLSEVLKNSYNFLYNNLMQLKLLSGVSIIVGFFAGLKLG